jgi:hypothetical protein
MRGSLLFLVGFAVCWLFVSNANGQHNQKYIRATECVPAGGCNFNRFLDEPFNTGNGGYLSPYKTSVIMVSKDKLFVDYNNSHTLVIRDVDTSDVAEGDIINLVQAVNYR